MTTTVRSLFPLPIDHVVSGFSTAVLDVPRISSVVFSDGALGVHKASSQTTHLLTENPVKAWEAFYPAGSINPRNQLAPAGGFGFYLRGPPAFASALPSADEVLMSYHVFFDANFAWARGGKLPGIYGGMGDSAYGCTGGRQSDRCKCFNLRLMWREDGIGELYAYLPHVASNTARLLSVPPRSIEHPDYGFSVGRGAWRFIPGRWTAVAQRVRLNRLGEENGEIELFIDGESVLLISGLVLRTEEGPNAHVQGMHFQTFFGGHSSEWASPRDQRAWFTNISGAILGQTPADISVKRDEL